MTDTSKEAVERVICAPIIRMVDRGGQPTLDGCAAIIDTARALLSERNALRAQLQSAKDEANALKMPMRQVLVWSSQAHPAHYERAILEIEEISRAALKSTSAEGE